MNVKNRIGKFSIDSKLVYENYELVNMNLSKVVVVECIHHFFNNKFEYHAVSPLFDVVEEGAYFNEYKLNITDDEIKFEKVVA